MTPEELAGYVDRYGQDVVVLLRRIAALDAAARHLLALKDGPRDDAYRAAKEPAWQALREALRDDA